jgi:hypothetical protein
LAVSFPILTTMDSHRCNVFVRGIATVKVRMTHIRNYVDNLQYTVDVRDVVRKGVGKIDGITLYRITWN